MLTSQKVINAINEPAFAKPPSAKVTASPGATAWRAEPKVIRWHPRNPQ